MTIGFIGAGRVATALALALAERGERVVAIASRGDSASALAAQLPGARAVSAQEVVDVAHLVFLAVSDDAVESLAAGLRWRSGVMVAHTSGVLEVTDVLSTTQAAGALVGGFHPLQTFSDTQTAIAHMPGSSIAIEAEDGALFAELFRLATLVGGKPFRLPAGSRALYHASAFFAAAAVAVVLQEGIDLWTHFGATPAQAREALLPLIAGTAATLQAQPTPALALSGPVARGDVGTVQRHLAALQAQAPESLCLYQLLSQRAVRLGIEKGTLAEPQAAQLRSILAGAPASHREGD